MTGEVLSSWKEIAAYLGKGVRTVQRWEVEMGLPVRRPGPERHIVIAIPAELDAWVRNGRLSEQSQYEDAKVSDGKILHQKLSAEQQLHAEQHRQHTVQLQRMRSLMTAMVEQLERNREHASRLVAQCSRQACRNGGEQKMKQSA